VLRMCSLGMDYAVHSSRPYSLHASLLAAPTCARSNCMREQGRSMQGEGRQTCVTSRRRRVSPSTHPMARCGVSWIRLLTCMVGAAPAKWVAGRVGGQIPRH
jgi:hypothetical protein